MYVKSAIVLTVTLNSASGETPADTSESEVCVVWAGGRRKINRLHLWYQFVMLHEESLGFTAVGWTQKRSDGLCEIVIKGQTIH